MLGTPVAEGSAGVDCLALSSTCCSAGETGCGVSAVGTAAIPASLAAGAGVGADATVGFIGKRLTIGCLEIAGVAVDTAAFLGVCAAVGVMVEVGLIILPGTGGAPCAAVAAVTPGVAGATGVCDGTGAAVGCVVGVEALAVGAGVAWVRRSRTAGAPLPTCWP